MTFGLNALHGRHRIYRSAWGGDWDSSNAYDFIKYTVSKGYQIDSWEFGTEQWSNLFGFRLSIMFFIFLIHAYAVVGNELSGSGVGARVGAEQYGKDLINLRRIINELYEKSEIKPALIAPGGFYDQRWFTKLLQVTGSGVVNVVTHHIYNLGAGALFWFQIILPCLQQTTVIYAGLLGFIQIIRGYRPFSLFIFPFFFDGTELCINLNNL